MKPGMGVLKALGLTTLLVCGTQTAFAQDYPARNITVVVPFPAGGPSDVVARIVAEAMGRTLGHTLVIENVAGAGGTIGSARVATASPDGYTLLAGSMGSHVAAPVLTPNIKYDPAKDFVAIGPTAHSPPLKQNSRAALTGVWSSRASTAAAGLPALRSLKTRTLKA